MDFKNKHKYFLIGLAFISLNIIHKSAYAKDLLELSELSKPTVSEVNKYSFGIDAVYVSASPRNDFSQVIRKNRAGANFYIGYNWDTIMLEIGYLSTTRKSKTTSLATATTFLGQPITVPEIFSGKARFKNTHLDLNFFNNFYEQYYIVTLVGIGFVRAHVSLGNPLVNINNSWEIKGKTHAVPRAGIGLSYFLNTSIAVRAMCYFDQYSKITLSNSTIAEGYDKPFKNAYTGSIGLLFRL